ncbi:hypothetical protein Tco_0210593 [Tanacetum coccineum]
MELQRVTPSSRSSRSSDHRRSRDDSPEYDRREGRDVSLRYSDDRDYSGRSELSPRHGRDNRHYNIKRSRYETSRTPDLNCLLMSLDSRNHKDSKLNDTLIGMVMDKRLADWKMSCTSSD